MGAQLGAGRVQRGVEAEGIAADKAQFEEERDFPYRQVSYMQSLLSGLPLATQSYSYAEPSPLSNILSGGGLPDILSSIYGLFGGNEGTGPDGKTVVDQGTVDIDASGAG